MKIIRLLAVVLGGYLLKLPLAERAWAGDVSAVAPQTMAAQDLPEPPRQHRPWKPPSTELRTNLISSAEILFNLGLADPRGCEYREFEMVLGRDWRGSNYNVRVHGWILPSRRAEKKSYAVGWDGLVHPVIAVGPKANLKQDVAVLQRAEEAWSRLAVTNSFARLGQPFYWVSPPDYSISETNPTAIKALLLFRLGHGRLAQGYWNVGSAAAGHYWTKEDANDPFRLLAWGWVRGLFDRSICAYVQSDDWLGLAEFRELNRLSPRLERAISERGFPRPMPPYGSSVQGTQPYFVFLQQLPLLQAEEERRVQELTQTNSPTGLELPDKTNRIAALISEMDEIVAAGGEFGDFQWHPTVKALVAEGDDAVVPLILCMKTDQRLTRSVMPERNFEPGHNVIPVKIPAQIALDEILHVHFETAPEYQAYWEKYGHTSQLERWYQTLQDDHAGRKQWMQAAENILLRTDGKVTYVWHYAPIPNATNNFRYVAEGLRLKSSPSVSDLFVKRILEIAPTNYAGAQEFWAFEDAARLGLMLVEWDSNAGVRALSQIVHRWPMAAGESSYLAEVVVAMARRGDTSGLDIYAKWLVNQDIADLQVARTLALEPLGRFPNHPAIQEVSKKLFQPGKADWITPQWGADLLGSQLLLNESFRLLVLQALTDNAIAGTFVLNKRGQYTIAVESSGVSYLFESDPLAPKIGEPVSFRVCDDVARRLSRIENLPELKVYWPEAKRDGALADIIRFLKENGDHLTLKFRPWPSDEFIFQ